VPPTDTSPQPLSEFYKIRRSSITDISGLLAFVFGWLLSGIIGWPYIKAGFDAGNPTAGVFRFVVVVFAGGIGCGIVGMALGAAGGLIWQQVHLGRRRRAEIHAGIAGGGYAETQTPPAQRADSVAAVPRVPLPALTFAAADLDVDAYVALLKRVGFSEPERARTATALEHTINISAWDGARLVGVARVLTDGYFFAALADLVVDPDLQRRGLGRELVDRAFERTPKGALFIGAPLASSGFFDRIGCDRGPTGFTMRRKTRR